MFKLFLLNLTNNNIPFIRLKVTHNSYAFWSIFDCTGLDFLINRSAISLDIFFIVRIYWDFDILIQKPQVFIQNLLFVYLPVFYLLLFNIFYYFIIFNTHHKIFNHKVHKEGTKYTKMIVNHPVRIFAFAWENGADNCKDPFGMT